MSMALTEKDKILQKDVEHEIESIGSGEWVVVYRHAKTGNLTENLSCALMPNEMVEEALRHVEWDEQPDVRPGCIQYGGSGAEVKYFRFGNDDGIELLVIERHFHGLKPESLEILEEFRLFIICISRAQKVFL